MRPARAFASRRCVQCMCARLKTQSLCLAREIESGVIGTELPWRPGNQLMSPLQARAASQMTRRLCRALRASAASSEFTVAEEDTVSESASRRNARKGTD